MRIQDEGSCIYIQPRHFSHISAAESTTLRALHACNGVIYSVLVEERHSLVPFFR
jgi:hypothetical protein